MNMYRSRSGSNQPEGLSIGEPEGVKKGKGKRKKVISKKTPKRRSCNLIALQWAQGAKWFSQQVLQWAQGVKEDWVCESEKLKCHVFWFGCEPVCLNIYVKRTVHMNLIFMLFGCDPGWFVNMNVSVYASWMLLISCYCGCSFNFVCLIIMVQIIAAKIYLCTLSK